MAINDDSIVGQLFQLKIEVRFFGIILFFLITDHLRIMSCSLMPHSH